MRLCRRSTDCLAKLCVRQYSLRFLNTSVSWRVFDASHAAYDEEARWSCCLAIRIPIRQEYTHDAELFLIAS